MRGMVRPLWSMLAGTALSGLLASTAVAQSGGQSGGQPTTGAGAPQATAAAPAGRLDEIVVTATKRAENLQDVPISVQAFGTQRLEQLNVNNFNDYARLLPSVSFQTGAPGYTTVYMRGISSGETPNHSASLPSVGIYLDEQPVTTINGALDVHIYDIERIEALAGPQGTLYGASSQAGTLRIITNKPRIGVTEGGVDLELNKVSAGDFGYTAEGFANLPINDRMAARVVAFYRRDAGFIDNVPGTLTFPTSGITIDNRQLAKDDFNTNDTWGGRAALKIDLDEDWEVLPQVMAQESRQTGSFAYDPTVGDLQVRRYYPDYSRDRWVQAALTVRGRIFDFDMTYAGAYMERKRNTLNDYSDYSFFYDTLFGYGSYFVNNAGQLINPSQVVVGTDRYSKMSHELRFTSPSDQRARIQFGAFYQRQTHNIRQEYNIQDLATDLTVTGTANSLWLTQQYRVDRDYAIFAEGNYDILPNLTLTGGIRAYRYNNTLIGFFGFAPGYSGSTGEAACFAPAIVAGSPCTNLDKQARDNGTTEKVSLQWKPADDVMLYATYATGFRPGGINRRGTLPPYGADTLRSYEVGWKTELFDRAVRFNGAVFFQKWNNFQFSFLGANGLTVIANAAKARVNGVETDINWAVAEGFTLTAAGAYIDAKLSENYCGELDPQGRPITTCADPVTPSGTRLPVTPKFKGSLIARYEAPVGGGDAHVQASVAHESSSSSDLRVLENAIIGNRSANTIVDLAVGWQQQGGLSLELFARNLFDERADATRFTACAPTTCSRVYVVPEQPQMFGIRAGYRF